jgi:hypothetical protein
MAAAPAAPPAVPMPQLLKDIGSSDLEAAQRGAFAHALAARSASF